MGDLRKIGDLMRADWDRRVEHDYLFWMSDGSRDGPRHVGQRRA